MKQTKYLWTFLALLLLTSLVGCQKKRISYTDMIKREQKEITAFMDKNGFTILKGMPNRTLEPHEFAEIKDGLYINIIEKGEIITENQVNVLTRFKATSIGEREKIEYNSIGPKSGGSYPLPFTYVKGSDSPMSTSNASVNETNLSNFLCTAMMDAINLVGINGKVRMIVSFRHGPSFTTKEGVALYFEDMTFTKKP